jgi:hypothetical protein
LVNKAWAYSFGDETKGRKALANRGWAPLNRALLTCENILKTRRDEDIPELERQLPVSNLNNGMAAVAIDKIISKRNIVEHRNKVLERKRLAGEEQVTMDKTRKMTSGKYWLNKKAKN